MKQYYAYEVEYQNGLKSFQLLPLSKEALFVEGKYFPESNRLVMIHPETKEVFDLIEKFDEEGIVKISKRTNRPQVERVRTLVHINHQMNPEDSKWFLENFVENAEMALALMEQHKMKPLIHTAENMETVDEVKENLIITS